MDALPPDGNLSPAATLEVVTLDVRGLVCPLPVLRARQASKTLAPGQTLTVLVTDPAAVIDFPCFCHHAGLDLVATRREGNLLTFEIRRPPTTAEAGAPAAPGFSP